ncbi:MAG TPA: hypothetical protein VGF38_16420 [Ktedonobacterales bacterium]
MLYVNFVVFFGLRGLVANPMIVQALIITGSLLTFVLGVLAVIIAAQRGHRSWSIAFAVLLALFAYSPLVLTWVQQSNTPFYNATTFYVDTTAITIVELCNLILPAIILAVIVLVYSLRYRHVSSQRQDATLQIERSQIQ